MSDIGEATRVAPAKQMPDEEEQTERIKQLASSSKIVVKGPDDEKPEEVPVFNPSKKSLEKWLGKVYVRRQPGIFVAAKYEVTALDWSETHQVFTVKRDIPELEYQMNCALFCSSMIQFKPKKPEAPKPPPPEKPKNPWSDASRPTKSK